MRIKIVEPFEEPRIVRFTPRNETTTLGDLLKNHPDANGVKSCTINNEWRDDWKTYPLKENDEVCLYVPPGWQIAFLIIAIILLIVSIVLAPRPQKPNEKKSQPALGFAGVSNTFASGTPKFFVLGIRRVFGHLIASKVELTNKDKDMTYSAVYFMGTGPILGMRDCRIGETYIEDVAGPPVMNVRLGTQNQTVFDGHEFVHMVYYDGREIPIPASQFEDDPKVNDPIIYTTKGSDVDQVSLFFFFSQGIQRVNELGVQHGQRYKLSIRYKLSSAPATAYVEAPGSPVTYSNKSSTLNAIQPRFARFDLDFPTSGQYDVRLFIQDINQKYTTTGPMQLFNVQETRFIYTAYPGNSLMEITGVANQQVTSFDELNGNCVVCGKLVEVYDETANTYVIEFTRNRVWHIRHLLTSPTDGLGARFNRTLWDDAAGIDAAHRYEELVLNSDGTLEQLDFCDVIINEPKPGWDWIKVLLSEGRAIIFPSGGKFKYVIDRDQPATMLYSYPGNIIQNTLKMEKGFNEKPKNAIRADFPDEDHDWKVIPVRMDLATRLPTDPERSDTISYASITRLSEIAREMDYRLKLAQLSRKWTWDTPGFVTISEPYDTVKLAYNTVDTQPGRGFVGFITEDSTTSQLILDRPIYLIPGHTYSAFVRHNFDSEERTVSSPIGITTSFIAVSSPFSFTPTMADNWVVGEQNLHVVNVKVQEIDFKQGNYTIKVTEKLQNIESLMSSTVVPVIPPISGIVGGTSLVSSAAVVPLLGAQAVPISSTVFRFGVIPAFNGIVGTYTSIIGTNTLVLDTIEPNWDDFFNGAEIDLSSQFNNKIVDYIGASRQAILRDPLLSGLPSTGQYYIDWPTYLTTMSGFEVESSTTSSPTGTWTLILDSVLGFEEVTVGGITGATNFFRFTPYGANGIRNTVGRPIVAPGITDTTAPAPLLSLDISSSFTSGSNLATFFANIFATAPLDRDFKSATVNFNDGSLTGTTLTTLTAYGYHQRSGLNAGPWPIPGFNLAFASATIGQIVYGSAYAEDFYGNKSASIAAISPTLIADF